MGDSCEVMADIAQHIWQARNCKLFGCRGVLPCSTDKFKVFKKINTVDKYLKSNNMGHLYNLSFHLGNLVRPYILCAHVVVVVPVAQGNTHAFEQCTLFCDTLCNSETHCIEIIFIESNVYSMGIGAASSDGAWFGFGRAGYVGLHRQHRKFVHLKIGGRRSRTRGYATCEFVKSRAMLG